MKVLMRIFSLIVAIVFLFAFTCFAQGWEQVNGEYYYYDDNHQMLTNTTTPDGYKVGADGRWIQETTAPSMAKAFGMDGKSKIKNPRNFHDDEFNSALSFLQGDWDYTTDSKFNWGSHSKIVPVTYCAIVGTFINQNIDTVRSNGKYCILLKEGIIPKYSKEELMKQQNETYNAAVAIYNKMHQGKITAGMSQYEIAKTYMDYCNTLGVRPSNMVVPHKTRQEDTIYMQYDSAWAGLVNHVADCGGRAAMMSVLLNLERIKTYGLCGMISGITTSGHIVNYTILDGKEYILDWAGKKLNPLAEVTWFIPDSFSLESARVASSY